MNLGSFQDLLYEAINEDVTFEKDVNSFMKANLKPRPMINKVGFGNINVKWNSSSTNNVMVDATNKGNKMLVASMKMTHLTDLEIE